MEQFKKGDYIVPLKDVSISNCWNNFVMKQETDSNIFKPETLINGSINNTNQAWYSSNFSNKSHWRYATKEEIIEYDRIGKPYDVTTLKPETNLEKAARLYPIGTRYIPLNRDGDPYSGKCETTRNPRQLESGIDVGSGYIYHIETNKWAEIISDVKAEPVVVKEDILAEAKRRYPVGTQYKNSLGQVFTSDFDPVISITDEIYVSIEFQSDFIWSNGKWAEIVDEPIYLGTNSKSFDIVFDKSLMDFSPSELPSMEIPELIMLEPCIRI